MELTKVCRDIPALIILQILLTSGQNCFPPNEAEFAFSSEFSPLPDESQAIITTYEFQCCGSITEWRAYLSSRTTKENRYTLRFQVFRPSYRGCYNMVGENVFSNITVGDSHLFKGRPNNSTISFQRRDVIGYSVLDDSEDGNFGVLLNSSFEQEVVWYGDIEEGAEGKSGTAGRRRRRQNYDDCDFSVGQGYGDLTMSTMARPLLSVNVSYFDCPVSLTHLISPSSTTTSPLTLSFFVSPTTEEFHNFPQASTSLAPSIFVSLPTENFPQTSTSLAPSLFVSLPTEEFQNFPQTSASLAPSVFATEEFQNFPQTSTSLAPSVIASLPTEEFQNFPQTSTSLAPSVFPTDPASPAVPSTGNDFLIVYVVAGILAVFLFVVIMIVTVISFLVARKPCKQWKTARKWKYSAPKSSATAVFIPPDSYLMASYHPLDDSVENEGTSSGTDECHIYSEASPLTAATSILRAKSDKKSGESLTNNYSMADYATLQEEPQQQQEQYEITYHYVPTQEQRQTCQQHYEQLNQVQNEVESYSRLQFFIEDQIYWAPASTTSGLYAQLASKKYREIQRNQIRIIQQIGSGQFGKVCRAQWVIGDGETIELAVKTLISGASGDGKLKLLQEAAIMGQFSHPNVIKLYGVVSLGEPVMICSELLEKGDLRSYLLSMASDPRSTLDKQSLFLKFSKEIAAGMDYLSQKSFVHRDLAARNILLNSSLICKIADFGMARDLMDDTYYRSSGGTIPVKWTAPEALLYKKYSHSSDVWSYGMVLFEIWSIGKKPFADLSNKQVVRLLPTKVCQPPPPGCPRALYNLMVNCWNPEGDERPSFHNISCNYLNQSSKDLLYWDSADDSLSPFVSVLGAALHYAANLYQDLQDKYKEL